MTLPSFRWRTRRRGKIDQTQQTTVLSNSQTSTTVFDQHEESSQDERAGDQDSQVHLLDSTLTKNSFMLNEYDKVHSQVERSNEEGNPNDETTSNAMMTRGAEMNSQDAGSNMNVIDQLPTPRDQEPKVKHNDSKSPNR